MKSLLLSLIVVLLFLSTGHCGEKVVRYKIFESSVYTIQPEIEVVLALTPEQQSGIQAAFQAMESDASVAEARAAFKQSDGQKTPEADAAKKAFYQAQEQANAKYVQAVDAILTAPQKETVASLNAFGKELWNQTAKDATWKERTAELHEKGTERLSEVLSAEQLQLLGIGQEKK